MTTSMKMEEDRSHMTERILNLTLEIIYLLTGEDHEVVMKRSGERVTSTSRPHGPSITGHPCDLLTPERHNMEKILEVTQKMIGVLTGEVPIRCQDVTVYFSMEEWEYLEGHKDLYKDVMMEDLQTLCFVKIVRKECSRNEKILNFLLEIIRLLTREDCDVMMKKSPEHETLRRSLRTSTRRVQNPRTIPAPPSLTPDPHHQQKILEVTQTMIGVLTGEVPIRCQDVTVYFSMEEWEYLEGHKDLYKDVMMDNQPPLTSPDGCEDRDSSKVPHISPAGHDGEDNGVAPCPRGVRSFLCSECGQSFTRRDHLERHARSHTGQRFPCVECGKCFTHKEKLNLHLQIHTGEKPYSCPECGRGFTRRERLLTHLRTHTGEKPYSCPECCKRFTQRDHLKRHEKSHAHQGSLLCPECGKCFERTSDLIVHQRVHAGKEVFPCAECRRLFVNIGQLTVHLRSHTGEKPFSCPRCDKSFSVKSTLNIHLRIHTGEKPYSCPECGKCFTQKENLKAHVKVHTGEKPFPCPECGKSYVRRSELATHLTSHTGEERFACSECGKRFTHRGKLNRHQRIHTGERPYCCSECGNTYLEHGRLLEHVRIHTGERPFLCTECGKCFTRHYDLVLHQRSHTGK
ncbi:uncharacterized protein ACMZJ9_020715 [Mantella aurantiaca]